MARIKDRPPHPGAFSFDVLTLIAHKGRHPEAGYNAARPPDGAAGQRRGCGWPRVLLRA
jgi:hypothetical protein